MKELVVVAIGGNSIIKDNASQSIEHQAEAVKAVADTVLEMLASDYDIVLTHGNGPQVGLDLRRAEIAHEREGLPLTPLANCVADTQGGIGYLIQQALNNRLARHGEKKAVTVVTQVDVVGDPGVVLLGMSRQIAPQTRSKALRRTKRVLDARQGMEGAKNAYRGSQEVKRADTPNQGLSGRQEPRQPPAKPICTEQAAMRLVGGRRPSVLQRWGSGVLPRRFPVALKALPEPWRLGFFWRTGSKNTQRILRRQKSNAG